MASFCAPSINVYSPDPKSVAGVNIKDTSFVCIGSSEKDCSLKDPVELPRAPVGVNVPDDTILISLLNVEAPLEILTLISTLWPLLIVSCGGEVETEKGS